MNCPHCKSLMTPKDSYSHGQWHVCDDCGIACFPGPLTEHMQDMQEAVKSLLTEKTPLHWMPQGLN